MKNVGNHNKKSESGSRGTPGSDDAYSTLQKNYNELLREHSRALIAVDQLRVAKYLARPRVYQSKVKLLTCISFEHTCFTNLYFSCWCDKPLHLLGIIYFEFTKFAKRPEGQKMRKSTSGICEIELQH